jgi:hypothetical protein
MGGFPLLGCEPTMIAPRFRKENVAESLRVVLREGTVTTENAFVLQPPFALRILLCELAWHEYLVIFRCKTLASLPGASSRGEISKALHPRQFASRYSERGGRLHNKKQPTACNQGTSMRLFAY